jgi:hypothetical protein
MKMHAHVSKAFPLQVVIDNGNEKTDNIMCDIVNLLMVSCVHPLPCKMYADISWWPMLQ